MVWYTLHYLLSIEFPDGGRDYPSNFYGHHSPIDDVDPQATRSLFVGNIPKNISIYELRDIFHRFGDVLVSFCWCLHNYNNCSIAKISLHGAGAQFTPFVIKVMGDSLPIHGHFP